MNIMTLIKIYLDLTSYCSNLLHNRYQINGNLLKAKNEGIIPKEGRIENTKFKFHGKGCRFWNNKFEVEVDFGPNGRYDGFDFFRIQTFYLKNKGRYIKADIFEPTLEEFNKLVLNNSIGKLAGSEDDTLYYLAM